MSRHALVTLANAPHSFGGVSAWIERITRALPLHGWRVTTLTHALDQKHLLDWHTYHPHLEVSPLYGRFARLRDSGPSLDAYLERERPDVVVVNSSYWVVPAVQRRKQYDPALRLLGVVHGDQDSYYSGLGFYRDSFDHVIGVSRACQQKLIALGYPSHRVSLLPCGVVCPPQPPVARPASHPLQIGYVGRLAHEYKRIFDFVPLVRALNALGSDYRLHFYGTGPDEAALRQQLAAVDDSGRVQFHGWIPAEQMAARVWSQLDVLVLVSDSEGLSTSMLEAMAHGVVPVVSRVSSGVPEIIKEGQTGYTFPIGDTDAAAHILALLARRRGPLAAMARQAWSLVHQHYSLEHYSHALARLFDMMEQRPAQMAQAPYRGMLAHPAARLVPGWLLRRARLLSRRGLPINEGYTTLP